MYLLKILNQYFTYMVEEEPIGGYIRANETIRPFLPYIQEMRGGVIAIGVHQGLDLLANSCLSAGVLIDYDLTVSYITRLILEFALHLSMNANGQIPTAAQIAGCFDFSNPDNTKLAERILGRDEIDKRGIARIYDFIKFMKRNPAQSRYAQSYEHYLQLQSRLESSWLSSPDKIRKIVTLYKQGRVFILMGDFTGKDIHRRIEEAFKLQRVKVDILFLSNAEAWFKNQAPLDYSLFSQGAVILRTGLCNFPNYSGEKLVYSRLSAFPLIDEEDHLLLKLHYNIQTIRSFRERCMRNSRYFVPSFGWQLDVFQMPSLEKTEGLSIIE